MKDMTKEQVLDLMCSEIDHWPCNDGTFLPPLMARYEDGWRWCDIHNVNSQVIESFGAKEFYEHKQRIESERCDLIGVSQDDLNSLYTVRNFLCFMCSVLIDGGQDSLARSAGEMVEKMDQISKRINSGYEEEDS